MEHKINTVEITPLVSEEKQLLQQTFRAVHRNFIRYASVYILLFIAFASNILLVIAIYQSDRPTAVLPILTTIVIVMLLILTHRYVVIYYTNRKALSEDIRENVKQTGTGRLIANGIQYNRLVYQLSDQTIEVSNLYNLQGWKTEKFTALKDTMVSLHYLPVSRLLLKVIYHNIASSSCGESIPLDEKQIQAFSQLPKKDRPTKQFLYEGTVTEVTTFVFHILLFQMPLLILYRRQHIRVGNKELNEVSNELQVGQHHKIVEFL